MLKKTKLKLPQNMFLLNAEFFKQSMSIYFQTAHGALT